MKLITLTIDDYDIAGPSYAIVVEEAQVESVIARIESTVHRGLYKIEVLDMLDGNNPAELGELIEELKIEAAEFSAGEAGSVGAPDKDDTDPQY